MASMQTENWGATRQGDAVTRYLLTNDNGLQAALMDYGATLTHLLVPDRDGRLADVVLGFDALAPYETDSPYFGCTVGRVANRITGGRFTLDGRPYELACNDGANHLHGGVCGFDKQLWCATAAAHPRGTGVRFTLVSPDGDEGYPGNLRVAVTFVLTQDDALRIEYWAETDAPTPVNLTNHSYFNLAGSGDILGHIATLHASHYTEADASLTLTGRILPVSGTPLDFRLPAMVGGRMRHTGIGGYDHNYVLDREVAGEARAGEVYEPASGRVIEVVTSQPGMQLYTGNFLDGIHGKRGAVYDCHSGFCLETQHFPDAVNQPDFPSIILRPGQAYEQVTEYRFSTR